MMLDMKKTTYVKCASPECMSHAREGIVCTYHASSVFAAAPWRQQKFTVIATDPEREWICAVFDVRAISVDEARRTARVELAKERRDDWIMQVAPTERHAA